MTRRRTAILVFDEVDVLDFTGPFAAFTTADELNGGSAFDPFTIAETPGSVRARGGLKIVPHFTLESAPQPQVLVIPGGPGLRPLLNRASLIEWVRNRARRAEYILSIGAGALILARAGLLDGLRVTADPGSLDLLRELSPGATVDPGPRFHEQGTIITTAGGTAGIDASLHAIARLLDTTASKAVSARLEHLSMPATDSSNSLR